MKKLVVTNKQINDAKKRIADTKKRVKFVMNSRPQPTKLTKYRGADSHPQTVLYC